MEYTATPHPEDEDDEAPLLQKVPISENGGSDGVFAAAEDYAEMVEQSWNKQKRMYASWNDDNLDESDNEVDRDEHVRTQPTKTNGSKKKRRKRAHGK